MKPVYIIMGVSGCGKTTIGKLLAMKLRIPFYDADSYHPTSNIEKMSKGEPLNDSDRIPWLDILSKEINAWNTGDGGVLACSALKESYRRILRADNNVQWIILNGDFDTIYKRIQKRKDHYMSAAMLQSQFDTLEIPNYGIYLEIDKTPDALISSILKQIDHKNSNFGIIGLGVMGASLAKNLIGKNVALSVYNRSEGNEANIVSDFLTEVDTEKVAGFTDISGFITSLSNPKRILMMIPAGKAVDEVMDSLIPHLAEGDIVIDAGNSHYEDTKRRNLKLAALGVHYFGIGVSGGEKGALHGPSIMVGGAKEAFEEIEPTLKKMAAKDRNSNPCLGYFGTDGAGHFVKMIHNGIEYAEMQLLAEVFSILKLNHNYEEIATILEQWNETALTSYLLEITIEILKFKEKGEYLLDKILDTASGKGTGAWSSEAALKLGVSGSMISSAVDARYISLLKEKRLALDAAVPHSEEKIDIDRLKSSYTFARLIIHHQGFEILRMASKAQRWEISLSETARVWTNGCIIRSELMETLVGVFKQEDDILNNNQFKIQLNELEGALKETLKTGFTNRLALPCLSAALNYWYGITTGQSTANLIQAQRDYFGAHGFQRTDSDVNSNFTNKWN